MKPVLTVAEMRALDSAATESTEVLVQRAGAAVARRALEMLGGTYGRRVVVIAGKGNNGDDGRVAAHRLARRGVRVQVLQAGVTELPRSDLVVDAAYGTGFRGEYGAPDPRGARVLAVDVPSGVDGDTGCAEAVAVRADSTVTFVALKPGLLLAQGLERAGDVHVADIGLDASGARAWVVETADLASRLPARSPHAHKWETAVFVVAGSAGMVGAARHAAQAALRAGAGYVRLGVPGAAGHDLPIGEAVGIGLPADDWDAAVLEEIDRFKALVVGPGLGLSDGDVAAIRRLISKAPVPTVVDASALTALGGEAASVLAGRHSPAVLTPHDGEFRRVAGASPGADRLADTRALADRVGAVVLLKGATTIVASPEGTALLATSHDARLATAGTGDVLSGVIAAFLANGLAAPWAAAGGAHAIEDAATLGPGRGFVASDLLDLLPRWLSGLE